jgi:hypothetical protein
MSKTKKTKIEDDSKSSRLTLYPVGDSNSAKAAFRTKLKARDDGSNDSLSHVDKFLIIAERVSSHPFGLREFLRESQGWELEKTDVERMFNIYVETFLRFGKIAEVPTVYDTPLFVHIA